MNKNLAAIIALLLTDGTVNFQKHNKAEIAIDNTSEILHKEFARLMKNEFGFKTKRNGIKSRIYSIELAKKLVQYTGTYRTKQFQDGTYPQAKIPEEIKTGSHEIIATFLKYAFTCDGSAGLSVQKAKNRWFFQKRIQLACKHPKLLEDFQELLTILGIHTRVSKYQGKLLIDNRKGIETFCNKIGFLDDVKISGKGHSVWKGLNKNDILRIYQLLYEISDNLGAKRFDGGYWMKNYKTKKQIIDFLRNVLLSHQGPGKLGNAPASRMQTSNRRSPNRTSFYIRG
jgi:hypothetical protein